MAIQFCCTKCGQPIEVDDEHAGQTAACPYCQHVVTVPPQSTYEPRSAVGARPVGPPPVPWAGAADVGAPEEPHRVAVPPGRRRVANTFGLYAIICTGLALLLFGAAMVIAVTVAIPHVSSAPSHTVTDSQMQQVQKELMEMPAFLAVQFGGLLFAVVGLVLGIVSLTQAARSNWKGTLSVAGCGLVLLCVCTATAVDVLRGAGAAGVG